MSSDPLWMLAAMILIVPLALAAWVCVRGPRVDKLAALQLAGAISSLFIMSFALGIGRSIYLDVALTASVVSYASGLMLARALERWF